MKITGYLQRLGISYFIVGMVHLYIPYDPKLRKTTGHLSKKYWMKMGVMVSLFLTNFLVSFLYQTKGCQAGYLGPGEGSPGEGCLTGGANLAIDLYVFGEKKIPKNPRCSWIIGCDMFDEDGLLGTLNFICGVFLGSFACLYYLQYRRSFMVQLNYFSKQIILLSAFTVFFTGFNRYNFVPINSQLWSISYVTVCAALSLALYIFVAGLSFQKKWLGWPFRPVGKNAFFILFSQQLFKTRFPLGFHHNGNTFDSVLSCLLVCSVWIGLAIVLHGYRFYIKY